MDKFIKEVKDKFNEEYRKAYTGILSEEILAKGNSWFIDFISKAVTEAYEMGRKDACEDFYCERCGCEVCMTTEKRLSTINSK